MGTWFWVLVGFSVFLAVASTLLELTSNKKEETVNTDLETD